MVKINETIVLRSKDTQVNPTTFNYTKNGITLDITSDKFYIYIKPINQSGKNIYKLNTDDNPTKLYVQNTNQLIWNHGTVDYAPDTYEYFIKRVDVNGEFTELNGTMIVNPEVAKK